MAEVRWSNRQNSGSCDRRRIGVSAHRTASTSGQTTEIVAPTTAARSMSPTIIPLSMKYFGVLFQGYAPEIYIYIYIYTNKIIIFVFVFVFFFLNTSIMIFL